VTDLRKCVEDGGVMDMAGVRQLLPELLDPSAAARAHIVRAPALFLEFCSGPEPYAQLGIQAMKVFSLASNFSNSVPHTNTSAAIARTT
jgi:hypothetical protein